MLKTIPGRRGPPVLAPRPRVGIPSLFTGIAEEFVAVRSLANQEVRYIVPKKRRE
jgi:hypothetical protein